MKKVTINLYSFAELSDDAKQKALEKLWDLNVDHEWWEFIYEDAENVGVRIKGFDLDRHTIDGDFISDAVAEKILKDHGENCETFKTAKNYYTEYDKLVEKYSDGKVLNKVAEDNEYEFDKEADELAEEFQDNILEDYLSMLRQEYEYQTSEEAIIESIEANEYQFTEDGELY